MKPIRISLALSLTCLGVLAGGLCSCAQLNEPSLGDPFLSASWEDTASKEPIEENPAADRGSAKSIEGIPLPVHSEEGPVKANHLDVREVKAVPSKPAERPNAAAPTSQEDAQVTPVSGQFGEWCPPPAYPVMGSFPQGFCPPAVPMEAMVCPPVVPAWIGGAAIAPIPRHYPDEYLCDGGDRALPVRYDFNMRLGLDTEDAVAEYTDHTGEDHVKPTNKVCVYSPRFGAMRTISSPVLDTQINNIASADKFQSGAGMRNRDATGLHKQHVALGKYRTRERASDIDVTDRSSALDQSQIHVSHTKLLNTFEDFQFVHTGQLTQTDEVRLAKGIQAAAVWSKTQFPVIAAQTEQAQEVIGEFNAQELVRVEDKRKPGRLRIVKLADKKVAQPGDVITFTLRYDNLGERELYSVRILDNLTPRLEYVEDSETSDRAGQLLLQDNAEGSLILEFVLDEPLEAKQGGVVTFQARVR